MLYSPAVARWEVERGARAADRRLGDQRADGRQPRVAVGEILRYRGEAELLEPPELRRAIAEARAGARTGARRHPATRAGLAPATGSSSVNVAPCAGRRPHVQRPAVRLRDRARDEEAEARARACRRRRWRGRTSRRSGPAARAGCPGRGPRPRPARGRCPPTRARPPRPPAGEYLTAFSTRLRQHLLQPLAVAAHARHGFGRVRDDVDLVLAEAGGRRPFRGRARRGRRR